MTGSAQHSIAGLAFVVVTLFAHVGPLAAEDSAEPRRIDPATWGGDHVGKPFPAYVTGDECLFCHRQIGAGLSENRHQLTIQPAAPDEPAVVLLGRLDNGEEFAADVRYRLGSRRMTRFLRRSKDYGKLDLLSTSFIPTKPAPVHTGQNTANPHTGELKGDALAWDTKTFADRCAGCHTTAVNAKTRAFSAVSLDCFTCHGDVKLAHTKDVSLVLLSVKSREPRQMISICGQCHLRGGKSKSTGLPYPNTFVAGDNLFRDFEVDFSENAIDALPAVDRHIYLVSRDVAFFDRRKMTCLTCHDVHGQSSEKHQQLPNAAVCASCHVPGSDNTKLREALRPANRWRTHSRTCDY